MTRPRLLVSVRSADEAEAAIAGGADIIDIKEPTRGPLGKPDDAVVAAVVNAVSGRVPVSAALGELIDLYTDHQGDINLSGLAYVKCGLSQAPHDWRARLATLVNLAAPARLVAVVYADADRVGAPDFDDIIAWAGAHQAAGVLIDTAVKDDRNLFDWLDGDVLFAAINAARRRGLFVALAGSLDGDAFAKACALGPDIVAVRGAACVDTHRLGDACPNRVRQLARAIEAGPAACPHPAG